MNWRIVRALVAKDVTLFFRNRFFAFITVVGLIFYAGLYYVMPRSVDETLTIGLYVPGTAPGFEQGGESEGLKVEMVDSEEALKSGVTDGQYPAGVALPPGFPGELANPGRGRVDVYFGADVPAELQEAITALVRELVFLLSGEALAVEIYPEILGQDMSGMQIPQRDRMLPLIGVFIMLTETLGLASLISEEIEARTIQALLTTPTTVGGLFAAKGLTGAGLAFGQVALFIAVTGGFSQQPLLILVALVLGSVLVTAIGFSLASLGKDLLSVVAWAVPVIVILSVPAFGVLFPGTLSDWVKIIPSYYLVDTIHQAANLGAGWPALWGNLLALLGFNLLFFGVGVMALGRKFR